MSYKITLHVARKLVAGGPEARCSASYVCCPDCDFRDLCNRAGCEERYRHAKAIVEQASPKQRKGINVQAQKNYRAKAVLTHGGAPTLLLTSPYGPNVRWEFTSAEEISRVIRALVLLRARVKWPAPIPSAPDTSTWD